METKINTKLLKKVKTQILKNHKYFDMAWYFDGEGCGTTACIAGWAIAISNKCKTLADAADLVHNSRSSTRMTAEELIGGDCTEVLFHVSAWPKKFRNKFESTSDSLEKARIACERIDYYIETGK